MLWPSVHSPDWLRMKSQTLPTAGPHADPTAPGGTSRRTAANMRGWTVCTSTETTIPPIVNRREGANVGRKSAEGDQSQPWTNGQRGTEASDCQSRLSCVAERVNGALQGSSNRSGVVLDVAPALHGACGRRSVPPMNPPSRDR